MCLRQRHFSRLPFFPFLTYYPLLLLCSPIALCSLSPTAAVLATRDMVLQVPFYPGSSSSSSEGEESPRKDDSTPEDDLLEAKAVSLPCLFLQCHHKAQPVLTYPEGCGSAFHGKTDYRRNTHCSLMNEVWESLLRSGLLTVPLPGCSPTV